MCHCKGGSIGSGSKLRIVDPTDGGRRIDPFDLTDPRNWGSMGDDPRFRGNVFDPRRPGEDDPRDPGSPNYDPRAPGGPQPDPRNPGVRVSDPRTPGGPAEDPRTPGDPQPDPRNRGVRLSDPRTPGGPLADVRTPGTPRDHRTPGDPPNDPRLAAERTLDVRTRGAEPPSEPPKLPVETPKMGAPVDVRTAGAPPPANERLRGQPTVALMSPASTHAYLIERGQGTLASALRTSAANGWT